MATKPMVAGDTATAEQDAETTLLDVTAAGVKRLIAKGKERGYITFDELNAICLRTRTAPNRSKT